MKLERKNELNETGKKIRKSGSTEIKTLNRYHKAPKKMDVETRLNGGSGGEGFPTLPSAFRKKYECLHDLSREKNAFGIRKFFEYPENSFWDESRTVIFYQNIDFMEKGPGRGQGRAQGRFGESRPATTGPSAPPGRCGLKPRPKVNGHENKMGV